MQRPFVSLFFPSHFFLFFFCRSPRFSTNQKTSLCSCSSLLSHHPIVSSPFSPRPAHFDPKIRKADVDLEESKKPDSTEGMVSVMTLELSSAGKDLLGGSWERPGCDVPAVLPIVSPSSQTLLTKAVMIVFCPWCLFLSFLFRQMNFFSFTECLSFLLPSSPLPFVPFAGPLSQSSDITVGSRRGV